MNETSDTSTDIFLWANSTDAIKDRLDIELYLFSKNYTVYATNYSSELKQQLKVLFLYDLLSEVQTGAAMGLRIRTIDEADTEDNTLSRIRIDQVQHAQEVMEQVMHGGDTIEQFSDKDHEFKRVKGMIAKFTYAEGKPFYVIKLLPQSQVLGGASAWEFEGGSFKPFSAEAGLRITSDNQVLIVGEEIFVFSENKFERLFGYSARKLRIAEEKIRAIEEKFDLSLPEGLTFESIVKEKPTLLGKLQKLDNDDLPTSEKLMEQSDDMQLDLMQDEAGAIIIMDGGDATKFVTLLSDDYMESPMTGYRYEIKSKRRIDEKRQG